MPSTVILEKKQAQVAALAERIKGSIAGVIVDYKGINVEDDTKLRKELREAGVEYTVVKNSLLKRAADEVGLEGIDPVLEGTTAIATSADDYVASARILQKYADAHDNFNVKSGYLDGEVIDLAKIQALAKLPSREVLLARGQFPPATNGTLTKKLTSGKISDTSYAAASAALSGEDNTYGCLYFNRWNGRKQCLVYGKMGFW